MERAVARLERALAKGSGLPFTATTTSTASRRRSSSGAHSRCSAGRSSTSSRSVCATATGSSRPRSIGCTPTRSTSSCRSTAASVGGGGAPRARTRRRSDHHRPPRARGHAADAVAVINPKRHDCTYPDKHLAGVGVALKLVQALCPRRQEPSGCRASSRSPRSARSRTSCRSLARTGSSRGSAWNRCRGARTPSACDRCSRHRAHRQDDRQLSGRLYGRAARERRRPHEHPRHRHQAPARDGRGHGGRGASLAQQLNDENLRGSRRKPTSSARLGRPSRPIRRSARTTCSSSAAKGGIRGVIGIAASKLVDTYLKPAIVLSMDGDVAHGSCRSIPDFDMLAALERCADVFVASVATSRRRA